MAAAKKTPTPKLSEIPYNDVAWITRLTDKLVDAFDAYVVGPVRKRGERLEVDVRIRYRTVTLSFDSEPDDEYDLD